MLTLSRKVGESIMIGNDVEITILETKGEQVKIGITAPKTIPIYCKELYLQIQKDNQEVMCQEASPEVLAQLFEK